MEKTSTRRELIIMEDLNSRVRKADDDVMREVFGKNFIRKCLIPIYKERKLIIPNIIFQHKHVHKFR